MFNKKISSTSRKSGLVFRTLIALAAISTPAAAASVQGIPNQVEYSATFLYVQHNSVNYIAQPASPGCGIAANSADTIKAWLNLSQAALLSGKQLKIYFTTCGSGSYILDLVLIR